MRVTRIKIMIRNIVLGSVIGAGGFALLVWPGYQSDIETIPSPSPTVSVTVSPTPTSNTVIIQQGLTKEEVEEILNEVIPTAEEITNSIKEGLAELKSPYPLVMPDMPSTQEIQQQIKDKLEELKNKFNF